MMYSFAKMPNVRIFVVKQTSRCFSTGNIKCNIARESRMLNKLLSRNQTKRNPLEFTNTSIFGSTRKDSSSPTKRRVNVLNKVFMEHITDLMSTGEIAPKLLNRNIEISHVEVQSNYKHICVFWMDNGVTRQPDTPQLLNECAGRLRQELCDLRVIGNVPPIQFVECKGVSTLKEVEERLKTLDFGEDHVPTAYPYSMHRTVTSTDENSEDKDDVFSVTLPMMRNNVFDLDHHKIMSKIKSSLNKSKVTLNKQSTDTESPFAPLSTPDLQNPPSYTSEEEQREQFAKFLIHRRKQEKYRNKHCKGNATHDIPEERNDDDHDDYDYEAYDDYDEDDTDKTMDDIDDYYADYADGEFENKH